MQDCFYYRIGQRIKDIRNHKGYSRDRLSELAGILGQIESGTKGMSAKTLFDLSQALGVSADCLLSGTVEISALINYAVEALAVMPEEERELTEAVLENALNIVRRNKLNDVNNQK